jgi:hypothetical protein
MFEHGHCALGQTGAAQAHLHSSAVTVGDVFLFFGLFADANGRDRHHRIFGYLEVQSVNALGAEPDESDQPSGFSKRHPRTIGEWNRNNTIYIGRGCVATTAPSCLRLSIPGERISRWRVPLWLRAAGLTYHGRSDRWLSDGTLTVVGRGQEFSTPWSILNRRRALDGPSLPPSPRRGPWHRRLRLPSQDDARSQRWHCPESKA